MAEIEQYIISSKATPEEITHASIRLAEENILEIHGFDYTEKTKPSPEDLITTNWGFYSIYLLNMDYCPI